VQFQNLHEGSVLCLEGTHNGRLLFTGGADGLLLGHDLRMEGTLSRVLWHHNAGVGEGGRRGLAGGQQWLLGAAWGC